MTDKSKKTEQPKKKGRPSKLTKPNIKHICNALSLGATHKIACESVGVARQTFYRWLEQADLDRKEGLDTIFTSFQDKVKRAEAKGALTCLKEINISKDWKAKSWLLSVKHGYRKEGIKEEQPEKKDPVEIPDSPLETLRIQAVEIREALNEARKAGSFQAYTALNRQFTATIMQIKTLEAELGPVDPYKNLTDDQLVDDLVGIILTLPPVLRQALEIQLAEHSNVIKLEPK